jgi:hypothetical protein
VIDRKTIFFSSGRKKLSSDELKNMAQKKASIRKQTGFF